VANVVPLERILLETDGPYMTPVPAKGISGSLIPLRTFCHTYNNNNNIIVIIRLLKKISITSEILVIFPNLGNKSENTLIEL